MDPRVKPAGDDHQSGQIVMVKPAGDDPQSGHIVMAPPVTHAGVRHLTKAAKLWSNPVG
jgi:hypothetical protein